MEIKGKKIGEGRPLVCVPVMEREKEAVVREIMALSESRADMVEWRVDQFCDYKNYNAIREVFGRTAPYLKEKIFLYTFRTKRQGGDGEPDGALADDMRDLAAESGCVDLVDMEFFEEEFPARKMRRLQERGVKVVASHHDFDETPERGVMKMLLEQMCEGNADIVKLAVMPRNAEDVLNLLSVTSRFKEENPDTPVITMSMGKMGAVSRLCGESFGSAVTFASHGKASAPGQMDMTDVADILDILHKNFT